MPTAQEFIAAASQFIGVTESPAGSNKNPFARLAGHADGQPWCASFVVAVARSVGLKLPSESPYTPTMANAFRPLQRLPEPGHLAFFNFPGDGVDRIQHVGIVGSVDLLSRRVVTIEGNTSPGPGGSQSNGGGVYRRTRPFEHVVGFGRPNFSKEIAVPEAPPIYDVNAAPVSISVTPSGNGYVILCADGGVFAFGDAKYLGGVRVKAS